MEAVLLAAGKGTRLRPYTENVPKPLLEVQGRPILDWTLAALPKQVARLVVVVNYLADQVESYLRGQRHIAHWTTVYQTDPLGTGDAFRSCFAQLRSERTLVLNGDDLYSAADLTRLAGVAAGVLVKEVQDPENWGIAVMGADGMLRELIEKPKHLSAPQLGNIGAYAFPAQVREIELTLSKRNEYEITEYVTKLAARQPVHAVLAEQWFPIGTVEAWQQAQTLRLPL